MDKTFEPQSIEQQCYQKWEEAGLFKASGSGDPYCILLPPPNVTGSRTWVMVSSKPLWTP